MPRSIEVDLRSFSARKSLTYMPKSASFDGTGTARKATFTVTAAMGTSSTTYYGIRVRATSSGSEGQTERGTLLQFGIGGG